MSTKNNQPYHSHRSHHISPCSIGFQCQLLRQGRCHFGHTEQHHFYIKTLKQLLQIFRQKHNSQLKLILGTLQKLEDKRYKLIPLNQEIISQFPGLSFILRNSQGKILSEAHYYEAIYQDEQNENGEFIVRLLEGDPYWGKIGQINDDIEALYYGKDPIYKDEDRFSAGDFKVGIIKEKYNGQVVLKCSSSQTKYIFTNEKHQNRAFVGSTVRFLVDNFERRPRGLQVAQVVSVLKCPLAKDYIYGILEVSPDPNRQIDMQHLYCPLPENINWNLLDEILYKPNEDKYISAISFPEPLVNLQDFQQKCSKVLNIDPQDPRLLYLSQKIIFHNEESQEALKIQNTLYSLCQLLKQRRNLQNLQTCYFKPFDKNLPMFQCMYIQDELKKNPEIWRSYIIASYITWPCSSKYPWVVIESSGGIIGDPQADIRIILERHKVQTDKFSWKVQKNEQEIIKAWENDVKKNLKESIEEKVFTIDGESTRYRDDGFSVKRLADGEYYEIGIHIADVTRIVKERSEIYKEAENRFHSCYIGRSFYKPMLPYNLQRYLSLQKDQWRYAFSMYILMNKEGIMNLEGVRIKHGMIKPIANLTYKQVDQMLSQENSDNGEFKEAVKIMKDLGAKLGERRRKLGCKLDISEEDEEGLEKNSQAQMMVEEFMLLANEIATEYIKNQGEELEKRLLKIKNEEKNMVREENKKKSEEEIRIKEEKKRIKEEKRIAKEETKKQRKEENRKKDEEKRKLREEKKALKALKANEKKEKAPKKVKVKKIVEKKVKKEIILEDGTLEEVEEHIKEEIEEEIEHHTDEHEDDEEEIEDEHEQQKILEEILEDKESEISEISEIEDVSEDEEIIEAQRRGSIEEYEEEVDSSLLNISKIEEFDAIAACAFLEQVWREIDKSKRLDLGDQRRFSESVRSIMDDKSIKNSIKRYLKYLLRLNDRKIRLFIHKKLRANNQQAKKEEHTNIAMKNNKPQIPENPMKLEAKHEILIESQVKEKEENINSTLFQQENLEKKKPMVALQEIPEKKLSKRKQAKLEKRPPRVQKQSQSLSHPLVENVEQIEAENNRQEIIASEENKVEELNQKDEPQNYEKLIFGPDDECVIDAKGIVMPNPKTERNILNVRGNRTSYAVEREKRVAERKQIRKERQLQKKLQKDSLLLAKPIIEPTETVTKILPEKDQRNEAKDLHCQASLDQPQIGKAPIFEPENKILLTTESRVEPHKEEEKFETQKKYLVEKIEQPHPQKGKKQKNAKQGRRNYSEPILEYIIKPSPQQKEESKTEEQKLKMQSQENKTNKGKFKKRKYKKNVYPISTEPLNHEAVKNEDVVTSEANLLPENIIANNSTNTIQFQERQIKPEKLKMSRKERKAQRGVQNSAEPSRTNTFEANKIHQDIIEEDIIDNPKKEESNDQQDKQRPKRSKRSKKKENNGIIPVDPTKQEKKRMKRLQKELAKRGMNFDNETIEANKIKNSDQDEIITPCKEGLKKSLQEIESLQLEQGKLEDKIQSLQDQEKMNEHEKAGEFQKQGKPLGNDILKGEKEESIENIIQTEEIKKILGMNFIKNDIDIEGQEVQNPEKTSKEEDSEQYEISKENIDPIERTPHEEIFLENQVNEISNEEGRQIENCQNVEQEPQESHESNPSSEPPKEIILQRKIEFDLSYSENIIKKYNKLKDSHKMKFTSPIRRFHDILVHELIDKILDLEKKFSNINNEIQKKLGKQDEKSTKKKSKKNKIVKTRYQIFQEIYSTMKEKIKQLEKSQEKIKLYYQENHDIKEGGMDRAEREKEIMEKCKLIISEQQSIITDAIVVGVREKVRVFLLDYGLECALGGNCKVIPGRHAMVKLEKRKTAMIGLFDEIIVRIDVKRNFPLDFEVVYVCGSSKN